MKLFIFFCFVGVIFSFSAETQIFKHPAVMNSLAELTYVKNKIAIGEEPWNSALEALQGWGPAGLSHRPEPRANVNCGSYSNPDNGCTEEKRDSPAAYAHALQWFYTGDERYAEKAIEILNAWASVIQTHSNSNGPLQSAWTAPGFARAAELIKHTYPRVNQGDVIEWEKMFVRAYLPYIVNGSNYNGNWEASMIESVMGIAVFLDSTELFDHGIEMFKRRLPAYIYHSDDGPIPFNPDTTRTDAQWIARWNNNGNFFDGMCQETCRDMGHTQYGIAALVQAAEIAFHQGVDLYGLLNNRLAIGMEFSAYFLNDASVPNSLCGGSIDAKTNHLPAWEIAFHHYTVRIGMDLPETQQLVLDNRPEDMDHHMAWGTLTHAEVPLLGPLSVESKFTPFVYDPLFYLSNLKFKTTDIYQIDGTKLFIGQLKNSLDISEGIYIIKNSPHK